MKRKKTRRPVRPDELRLARTWWMRVYVTLVHRNQMHGGLPKALGLREIDTIVAHDVGVSLSTVRCVRNGWDNFSPARLKALKGKLGTFSSFHSAAVMGAEWKDHLTAVFDLISGEVQHAKIQCATSS